MTYISEVLLNGKEITLGAAEQYMGDVAMKHGLDPAEFNEIWSRLIEGDYDEAQDAAAECEWLDTTSSVEFILVDNEEDY